MPLETVEIETAPNPTGSVIWLHGLGADAHDFEPIIPQLVDRAWPALRFVFPQAPVRAITVNGGMRMRAWYDITGMEIAQRQDETGIRASIGLLDELIARENARGIANQGLLIAGFSQGGAIALAGGLRHRARLGGIIALSTYMPLHLALAAERSEANADLPVFMGHGTFDPVVPLALGTLSRDMLIAVGQPVAWHTYPMAHEICPAEIADLRTWIGERISDRATAS
jgi:phospholipase/carboxylesterase